MLKSSQRCLTGMHVATAELRGVVDRFQIMLGSQTAFLEVKTEKVSHQRLYNQIRVFFWVTPSQWVKAPRLIERLSQHILEDWDQFSPQTKGSFVRFALNVVRHPYSVEIDEIDLISVSSSRLSISFLHRVKIFTLLISVIWASFSLKRDVWGDVTEALDNAARDILGKLGIVPGYPGTKVLILSDTARDQFLKDLQDPPVPTQALVSAMKHYCEASDSVSSGELGN